MKRLMLLLVLASLIARSAAADLAQCLDATCRIRSAGGVVGTGCVFDESADSYLILTNAHVVGQNSSSGLTCEFWRNGYAQGQAPAKVLQIWRSDRHARDIAVASVAKSDLSMAPAIVPLAPRGVALPSRTVLSVGCALGGWPTAWKGHVLEAGASTVWFLPTPADGRSGSALFNEKGTMIVGLVGWRSADAAYGIAMHVAEIYAAFDGEPPVQAATSETAAPLMVQHTPPASCMHGLPLTRLCGQCQQGNCQRPFGLFGNRQQPQEDQGKLFGDGQYNPWRSADGDGDAPIPAPPDTSSLATRSELAAVESRLSDSMQQVNQRVARLETQTQTALDQSQRAADEAESQRTAIESTHTSILERLKEFAPRGELIAKYQEAREAGAEAGRQAAKNAAVAIVSEKLAETGSFSLWSTLIAALGISGPIGIGLAALGWFVSRRVGRRIVQRSRGAQEAPQQAPFRGESARASDRS